MCTLSLGSVERAVGDPWTVVGTQKNACSLGFNFFPSIVGCFVSQAFSGGLVPILEGKGTAGSDERILIGIQGTSRLTGLFPIYLEVQGGQGHICFLGSRKV